MSLSKKELLYQLAEESAWSFKGHMKTADAYGFTLASLIVVPLLTSVIVLIFDLPIFIQKICALAGFLFSTFALMSTFATNKEKADQAIKGHVELGNKYLDLYNEIKVSATDISSLDQTKLSQFQKKIGELNTKTGDYRITLMGRWWSWWKIEKEMDLKWLYKKDQ